MIAELGHFALILALGVAIVQTLRAAARRALRDRELMAPSPPAAQCQFAPDGIAFLALINALRDVGLLGRECGRELAFGEAAALQDLGRVGKP